MIKYRHKIVSIVVCAALLICSFLALAFTADATTGDTVYVRVNNGWSTSSIYCYMWKNGGGSGNENHSWPGVAMTKVSGTDNIFSYRLTDDYTEIIFNTGSGGKQTENLTYTGNGGDGKIYDLSLQSWSQYIEPTTSATLPTVSTAATESTASTLPSGVYTVYLKNSAKWSTPKCYMWNSTSDNNADWSGVNMTLVGDDVWSYTASKAFANCIFSDNGANQTGDLTAKYGFIYDNQTQSWTEYDTSPIRVKSYNAAPSNKIYTGMEVVLSAEAESSDGTISYKFSVNGNILRDFSSNNSVSWIPNEAGEYTVTFDFKDSAGNENSRTLTLTVLSDSGLATPIIKTVTPSNSSYIKKGEASAVTVTAGGGQTGTNLLFYKYVIVAPSGEQNTAYYTLNNYYSFTPTEEGEYKISVFVQSSDNTTVSKTVTVTSTGGEIPTTPTDPVYQLGDVNRDGVVSILDATYIQMYLAEYSGYNVTLDLGDMNKDGVLTITDVTAIQRKIAEFS